MVQADPHESLSIFFQCEFSHGKITCYPVFLHLNSKIIKIRCITCPHLHILNRNLQPFIRLSIKCSYGSFCCTFHRICYSAPGHVLHWIIRYIFLQLFVDLWLLQHNLYSIFCTRPDYDTDFFLIRFRERLHFFYILFRDSFQPDSLPDPTLSRIEHAASFQLLLSPGMIRCITQVFHSHNQIIFSCLHCLCDLKFKRQIPTCMLSDPLSIHPYNARLIHSSKVKKQSFLCQVCSHPGFRIFLWKGFTCSFCLMPVNRKCPVIPQIFIRH